VPTDSKQNWESTMSESKQVIQSISLFYISFIEICISKQKKTAS